MFNHSIYSKPFQKYLFEKKLFSRTNAVRRHSFIFVYYNRYIWERRHKKLTHTRDTLKYNNIIHYDVQIVDSHIVLGRRRIPSNQTIEKNWQIYLRVGTRCKPIKMNPRSSI